MTTTEPKGVGGTVAAKVLLLGWKAPVVRALVKQGLEVLCVVEPGRTPDFSSNLLQVVRARDTADASEVLAALFRHGQPLNGISHVLSAKEFPMVAAGILSKALNARGMEMNTAVALRDKSVQKALVRDSGVTTAASTVLNTWDDFTSARLQPPFVIKPLAGGGAHNTFVVKQAEDGKNRIRGAFRESAPLLAETYIEGNELHADGVVRDGRVKVLTVSRYLENLVNVHHGAAVGSVSLPESSHGELHNQVREMTTRVLQALQHRDGVFHLEAFVTRDRLVFSECAGRVGGGKIDSVFAAATGIDLHEEWVNAALGLPMSEATTKDQTSSFGQLRLVAGPSTDEEGASKAGHKQFQLPTREEVLAQPSVLEAALTDADPTKRIDATAASNLAHGWVMAQGKDPDSLAHRLQEIANWFAGASTGTQFSNQGTTDG